MEDVRHDLVNLARDLDHLALTTDDSVIAGRLTEMAGEVLELADRHAADSRVYHSAIIFIHTDTSDMANDPHDCPTRPTHYH